MTIPLSPIDRIRSEYVKAALNEKDLNADPIQQFIHWFNEARAADVLEPSAMTLATVNAHGRPSIRTVLLKNVDPRGFIFYTNYDSQKGKDLAENNQVSLLFFWPELERQVRIEGLSEKISRQESETYFHSRPIGSQIGAISSPQSEVIESRDFLDHRNQAVIAKYLDKEIPMPAHWGGYLIVPHRIEFWQGRANRLHDRLVYSLTDHAWRIDRLAP